MKTSLESFYINAFWQTLLAKLALLSRFILSVLAVPGNQTNDLDIASATLYCLNSTQRLFTMPSSFIFATFQMAFMYPMDFVYPCT